MMRSRTIRPGFFDNFDLGRLSRDARLLFAGLWCIADREGRMLDLPRRIAAEVFPHDSEGIEADVTLWLAQLASIDVIQRYEVNGGKYIVINNFTKHQKIHKDEALSRIPPPSENPARIQRESSENPARIQRDSSEILARFQHEPSTNPARTQRDSSEIPARTQRDSLPTSTSTSTSINPPTPLAGGHTPPTPSKPFEAPPSNTLRTPVESDTRINALADTYPTTAGRQQGIRAICEIVSESANPETALAGIETHWPAWCEFLGERDAQYRPRLDRFVRSNDWMHAPPEPTRKGKTAEQPAKPDCLWDLNEGVDAAALGLTADEFEARLAAELGGAK